MKKFDIITVLDVCVDLILYDALPEFSQAEKLISDYAVEMGGSAAIFACQCARLGLKVAGVGRVGRDAFGRVFVDALRAAGVDDTFLREDASLKTGLGTALCAGSDRAILTYLGTIAAVTIADISDALLLQARHLHIASPYLMPQMDFLTLAQRAKALGLSVSLDTNFDPLERYAGARELLAYCDVFLPNEQELCALTGAHDIDQGLAIARKWAPHVAVKLGAQGARYAGMMGEATMPGFCVDVVDAIGAGDSFDGGFLSAWLSGKNAADCLCTGCATGALSTRKCGGSAGQGDSAEVQALFMR